jgi:superfamily I DNA/RNA helicase
LDELVTLVADQHHEDADVDPVALRKVLQRNQELMTTLNRAWPTLEPAELVVDLWSVPAYLRRCAPWLSREEVLALQRKPAQAWTVEDLPFLDAARQRLGDPETALRRRRTEAAVEAQRQRRADVTFEILDSQDDFEGPMIMLHGKDLQDALIDDAVLPGASRDELAGPFAHIVVDEAQELTDAEWQMLLLRNPSRSFTIVGDRAQARHGFTGTWAQRLGRIGLDRVELAPLTINYRTPEEIMQEAEPVIRAVLPDANVPTSIRSSGLPVLHADAGDLPDILDAWLVEHHEGTACVIGDHHFRPRPRVHSLTPTLAKGLEFDLVVLVDPDKFGEGIEGAVDRYVAMTRATRQLVILT